MAYNATFDGPMLSMASCEIKIAGDRYVAITKVDLQCGLKAEPERGTGPIAIGTAIGEHSATLTFDQHKTEADLLKARLANLSGQNSFALAEANFSIVFNATVPPRLSGISTPITSVLVERVRFLDTKEALANDGKSIISSWTTVVTIPIRWTSGGKTYWSIDPNIYAPSNSISIGLGGAISIGG